MSDLGPGIRDIIEAARPHEDPRAASFDGVRSKLVAQLGAAGFAASVASTATAAGAAGTGLAGGGIIGVFKVVAGLALVGGVVGGGIYLAKPRSEGMASPVASAVASSPASVVVDAPVSAAPVTEPQEPTAVDAPSASPAKLPRSQNATPQSDALAAELRLIGQAQAALGSGDARQATRLLDEHAAKFPRGQFAQEREGLRLLAACSSGSPGAKERARRFVTKQPGSALAGRLRSACGL